MDTYRGIKFHPQHILFEILIKGVININCRPTKTNFKHKQRIFFFGHQKGKSKSKRNRMLKPPKMGKKKGGPHNTSLFLSNSSLSCGWLGLLVYSELGEHVPLIYGHGGSKKPCPLPCISIANLHLFCHMHALTQCTRIWFASSKIM